MSIGTFMSAIFVTVKYTFFIPSTSDVVHVDRSGTSSKYGGGYVIPRVTIPQTPANHIGIRHTESVSIHGSPLSINIHLQPALIGYRSTHELHI